MNKREDFKSGTVVFLSQYPVDSASFALVVDHDFWMDEVRKQDPTICYEGLGSTSIPLRILGTRINVGSLTDKGEPNDRVVEHYTCANSGGHILIVDLETALNFLWMMTNFSSEVNTKYFDEVFFELNVLKEFLNSQKFHVDLYSMGPFKVKFLELLRRAIPKKLKE